jgi:hypothetical protein
MKGNVYNHETIFNKQLIVMQIMLHKIWLVHQRVAVQIVHENCPLQHQLQMHVS